LATVQAVSTRRVFADCARVVSPRENGPRRRLPRLAHRLLGQAAKECAGAVRGAARGGAAGQPPAAGARQLATVRRARAARADLGRTATRVGACGAARGPGARPAPVRCSPSPDPRFPARAQAADDSSPVHPEMLALVANVLEAVVASNELQQEQRAVVSGPVRPLQDLLGSRRCCTHGLGNSRSSLVGMDPYGMRAVAAQQRHGTARHSVITPQQSGPSVSAARRACLAPP
jgi:hypothetical protein